MLWDSDHLSRAYTKKTLKPRWISHLVQRLGLLSPEFSPPFPCHSKSLDGIDHVSVPYIYSMM